jgi:hypothetical protein
VVEEGQKAAESYQTSRVSSAPERDPIDQDSSMREPLGTSHAAMMMETGNPVHTIYLEAARLPGPVEPKFEFYRQGMACSSNVATSKSR